MKKQSKKIKKHKRGKRGDGIWGDYVQPAINSVSSTIGDNYAGLDLVGSVARSAGYEPFGKILQNAGEYGYNKKQAEFRMRQNDIDRHYHNNPQFGSPSGVAHATSFGHPGSAFRSRNHSSINPNDFRQRNHMPNLITRKRRRRR